MSDFTEYLISKKIDPEKFKSSDPDQFQAFELQFDQMHPESFTAQKLFLINQIRRENPLTTSEAEKKPAKPKFAKPKMKPQSKK